MLFFDYSFLFVFLPAVLAVYYALRGTRRNAWLFFASLCFYSVSSWVFLPVLLASTSIDFLAGRSIGRETRASRRKLWLLASITANLGLLGYFKYAGFFTEVLHDDVGLASIPILRAALPVGISFYTFQSMSYTIDVYRGSVTPARRFVDFAAYVTMFPQLIAGPIVRYSQLAPQLESRSHSVERFSSGIFLFAVGMAKKVLVADTLALLAAPLFGEGDPSCASAWTSMLLFAGQIYFDFSGYTDMAIGLGRMLGFEFPVNFDSPYQAVGFQDFWRRWHITLSTWLRDYLYIPLGGNRRGRRRTYVNLLATMVLGGLWHGASWNFLLWGLVHGTLLAVERALRGLRIPPLPPGLRRLGVFAAVTLAWVPFKFESLADTQRWIGAMLGLHGGAGAPGAAPLLGAALVVAVCNLATNSSTWKIRFSVAQTATAAALFASSVFVAYGRVELSPFLYFRF